MSVKNPSLKDVAQLAGVSPATASTVINKRVGKNIRVGEDTQKRILEAVQKLGYVANPAARGLAGQRNQIISIFTYEPIFPLEYRNFYYPFLLGIEREAERQGYDLLFMTSTGSCEGPRSIYCNGMNRLKLADGAILLGLSRNEEEIMTLARERFPIIFIGHREFPGIEVSYVAADYTEITAELINHIVKKGHRHMVLVRTPEDTEPGSDREAGYRLAHKILGLQLVPDHITRQSADMILPQFIERTLQQNVTVFIAETYAIGYNILCAAQKLGLEVPRDLSIAILGGAMDESAAANVDWTTFNIPGEEMGAQAMRLLVEVLENKKTAPVRVTLECHIIPGSTVAHGPHRG